MYNGNVTKHFPRVPEATVTRLPLYLRLLKTHNQGKGTISSTRIAELAGVTAAIVRKDLSYLGSFGTRGVGYDMEFLVSQINRELGLDQNWSVVVIGMGHLGHALARYGGFLDKGFQIVSLLDNHISKIGEKVGDVYIENIEDLNQIVKERDISIGIIATPGNVAQDSANRLVEAGVKAILCFAPCVVDVPKTVTFRKVDMAIELQILSFYQQRKSLSENFFLQEGLSSYGSSIDQVATSIAEPSKSDKDSSPISSVSESALA